MKRLTALFVSAIFIAMTVASSLLATGAVGTEVDGAAAGLFPDGSGFNGVGLLTSTFGQGVTILSDGSATGDFFTVLAGTSVGGEPQNIVLSGVASSGSGNGATATFSGTGLLDMGDGTPALPVPFSVTVTSGGLTLAIAGTTLPTQTLTDGGINIQPW